MKYFVLAHYLSQCHTFPTWAFPNLSQCNPSLMICYSSSLITVVTCAFVRFRHHSFPLSNSDDPPPRGLRRNRVCAPRSVLERAAMFPPQGCHSLLLLLLFFLILSHLKLVDGRRRGRHKGRGVSHRRSSGSNISPITTSSEFLVVSFSNSWSPFSLGISRLASYIVHDVLEMNFIDHCWLSPILDCLSLASLSFVVKM